MDISHIAQYKSLDFFARQVVEGFITGKHKSPFHGFSVEFSDYRQYNPGESLRNIDYRLYGRTDRLYVKQFEEETNLRSQLFIDGSRSMLFPVEGHANFEHPNKLTFSIYATAALMELLHRQRDAFGITLYGTAPQMLHTPCRSSRLHQQYILGELEKLLLAHPDSAAKQPAPAAEMSLPQALHLTAEQVHRRSLVVVFTDALVHPDQVDALFDALRHLRHNKHEVILFHTYDLAHEVNLDFNARPHIFIDLETGQQLKLQPSEVADAYRRQMSTLFNSLRQRAMQYRVDYVPVDLAQGFHHVILPFLLKRSKAM